MGEYKGEEYYNVAYRSSEEYAKHFTESVYYPSWLAIIHLLKAHRTGGILDIGCGPGQFAAFCAHYFPGLPYFGIDFSATAIEQAKARRPDGSYMVADLSRGLPIEPVGGQTVVALEFLEHVHFDLDLLQALPFGTRFVGSVPNFDWSSHVRYFETVEAVRHRYGHLFSDFDVQEVLLNKHGTRLFLMSGVRDDETIRR